MYVFLQAGKWTLVRKEFEEDAAEGPYIGFERNAVVELLWTHIPQCTQILRARRFFTHIFSYAQIHDFHCLMIFWKKYIIRFQILVNNFLPMQIFQSWNYLKAYLSSFESTLRSIGFQILRHISAFHQLLNDMKFMIFGLFIIFTDEIFVFYYMQMNQFRTNAKLSIHLLKSLIGQFAIIEDLPRFAYETFRHVFECDFVDFSLCALA